MKILVPEVSHLPLRSEKTLGLKTIQTLATAADGLPKRMVRPCYWKHGMLWSQDMETSIWNSGRRVTCWPAVTVPEGAMLATGERHHHPAHSAVESTWYTTNQTRRRSQQCSSRETVREETKCSLIRSEACSTWGESLPGTGHLVKSPWLGKS